MFSLPFFRRDLAGAEGRARHAADAGRRRLPRMGGAARRKPRLPRAVGAALGRRRARPRRLAPAPRRATARISRRARPSPSSSSRTSSGKLVGGITLGNIRHGVAQTGQIGYWIGERYAGRGLMLEALGLLVALRLRYAEVAPDRGSLYSGQPALDPPA